MSAPILATKLYIPARQPNIVLRPRLIERLNQGLSRKLTLVSAPAGFGKTTLVSEWVAGCGLPVAWLSLDERDSDPIRFLVHLVAAVRTVEEGIGAGLLDALQSLQPPTADAVLTNLLNEISAISDRFVLVLDDYHVVDAKAVDEALGFLLEHLPQQIHPIIVTREDPNLPLARSRSRGQLTELRASDLRFTASEAAEFLNQVMGLDISTEDISALETRTEGWIAGLQLAAISMQGVDDTTGFIESFTGSHRFVLDYLMEEVLQRQPESIQNFLLHTSILDRMCGPLCDAVLADASTSGQDTLEYLERANLFVVPLDNERRWFRYHHLFGGLLRQRLHQSFARSTGDERRGVAELHVRASEWYEEQGLEFGAFHHAAAANDFERAARLATGKGAPLYVRGGATSILNWLESLPKETLDARPSLWVMLATVLSIIGKLSRVEENLQAAENALQTHTRDQETPNLLKQIANLRELIGLLTADPDQIDSIIARSQREQDSSRPDDPPVPPATSWKLGLAYQHRGKMAEAYRAYSETISKAEAAGNIHVSILATSGIGRLCEFDTRLQDAAKAYRRVLQLVGEPPGPVACEAYVGLARLSYEWNDLNTAEQYGTKSLELARQIDIASFVSSELILARLQLARGDEASALASLIQIEREVRHRNFAFRLPEVVAERARVLLRQGHVTEAEEITETYDLPVTRARIYLARQDGASALSVLQSYRQKVEAKGRAEEQLRALVLEALSYDVHGERENALQVLGDAMVLAEPGGFIRIYIDEGTPMAHLLSEAVAREIMPEYAARLLAEFESVEAASEEALHLPAAQPLVEPLSERELEVLRLIAQGLSNEEISERLYIALSTVKGHNRNIFGKLEVQRRTEAVARARELALL